MRVLIPMAGKGERFVKENYSVPKPLLPVDNFPMVVKAALDLPAGDDYTFVLLREHIDKYHIDEIIKQYIPNAGFVILNIVTQGQACTCLEALRHADDINSLMIGACDNGMIYNMEAFILLTKKADAIVFTFRNNVTVVEKPTQYGWVKVEADNRIIGMSVKQPISNSPINDHAVVGAFWFKTEHIFKEAANRMIGQNRRINNEFYVDETINDIIQLGYKAYAFEVDKYICWGTPNDYRTYNYWESFFKKFNI